MIKTKLGIWQLIQWIENQNDTLDKKIRSDHILCTKLQF